MLVLTSYIRRIFTDETRQLEACHCQTGCGTSMVGQDSLLHPDYLFQIIGNNPTTNSSKLFIRVQTLIGLMGNTGKYCLKREFYCRDIVKTLMLLKYHQSQFNL
jgi:hypothetical protein